MNVKCTMIKPPYKWTTANEVVVYDYHSAHTVINPNWKWWKFWVERFISVPAGWVASFFITGNIGLDLSEKPSWHFAEDKPTTKKTKIDWSDPERLKLVRNPEYQATQKPV